MKCSLTFLFMTNNGFVYFQVAFKLVDFKENIMFIHIPINANSSLIAELFKSVEIEIENWHLEDQIEVI